MSSTRRPKNLDQDRPTYSHKKEKSTEGLIDMAIKGKYTSVLTEVEDYKFLTTIVRLLNDLNFPNFNIYT